MGICLPNQASAVAVSRLEMPVFGFLRASTRSYMLSSLRDCTTASDKSAGKEALPLLLKVSDQSKSHPSCLLDLTG